VCNLAVISFTGYSSPKYARLYTNACRLIVFSSSLVNPLLYYWRIKELRDRVRGILRNFSCKENEEEAQ